MKNLNWIAQGKLEDYPEIFVIINNQKYQITSVHISSNNPEHNHIFTLNELNEVINDYVDMKGIYRLTIEVPNFDNIPWNSLHTKIYDVKVIFIDGEKNMRLGLCGGTGVETSFGSRIMKMTSIMLGAEYLYKEFVMKILNPDPNGYIYNNINKNL